MALVTSDDVSESTSLEVNDARWFYSPDKMGITDASSHRQSIMVGSRVVDVLWVDYDNDIIKISSGITRSEGDGVNYATDYAGKPRVAGSKPDMGAYEYFLGWEWGKSKESGSYTYQGWTEGSWTGNGEIEDGAETGNLAMDDAEYFYGPVVDRGVTTIKGMSISHNNVTGSGTICWRGQATSFAANASDPSWEVYTAKTNKSWRYVQIGVENVGDCDDLP